MKLILSATSTDLHELRCERGSMQTVRTRVAGDIREYASKFQGIVPVGVGGGLESRSGQLLGCSETLATR